MAYAGTYRATDEGVVEHHISVSLLPNWIGTVLARTVHLEGEELRLSLVDAMTISGREYDAVLTWRRG